MRFYNNVAELRLFRGGHAWAVHKNLCPDGQPDEKINTIEKKGTFAAFRLAPTDWLTEL
jgi:hypothetical protein